MRALLHWWLGLVDPFGRARWANKVVLIGLTEVDSDNQPLRQVQAWGRIVNAMRGHNFLIELDGHWKGYFCSLPPDPNRFRIAPPGDYALKSTGEMLRDPDFTTTWISDLDSGADLEKVPGLFLTAEDLA
ncbi:hypothetical protein HXX25_01225 [Hyphobacterium sp. CCMP332]|uniref:hypothetical protein n=1 Tax=Hyphobacterium sp. CCMP332 TaxID=2749086 RepID=UPI001650319C|nr:hypothetical protein [Hyphobacterium sp. CCMP332]QNL18077.1 hypothetical protein HXX25_01225 [Hyphobacterium sp. CCMP332]